MKVMSNPTICLKEDFLTLPKISIITPCFNHAKYLEATILSVLEQGYPNLEYIIMDGGSTDGSIDIIKKYDKFLTSWRSHEDEGQYQAINEGFLRTRGEIMAWINSDDMLHRNSLWTIVEIFQQFPQVLWLLGNPTKFDIKGRTVYAGSPKRWSRINILKGDFKWIQQESVFWRRNLWEKAGNYLDTSYKYAADFELWVRFFRYTKLYPTRALIGGFRSSSSEQKGRKFRKLYLQEVEKILKNEKLTQKDKQILRKIKIWERCLLKFPVLPWRLKKLYYDLFQYPPIIEYDYEKAQFIMR